MKTVIKKLGLALGLGVMLSTAAAQASYPDRTVSIVVNYPPGGQLDLVARVIGDYASKKIGQAVVVENKAGAAGLIGAQYVSRQKPDGYSLLLTLDGVYTVNPFVYKSMSFSPSSDLMPIGLIGSFNQVLLTHPTLKTQDLQSFLQKGKEQSLTYSSAGVAAPGHLTMEMFNHRMDLDLLHVPYKGNAPATQALLAGEVDGGFLAMGSAIQYVETGHLVPLAVSGQKRDPRMPEVPTLSETGLEGLSDFDAEFSNVLMAPKGMDDAIIQFWSQLIQEAMNDDEVKARLTGLNLELTTSETPEAAKQYLDRLAGQWKTVVETANISIN